jgi:hypothetical protein
MRVVIVIRPSWLIASAVSLAVPAVLSVALRANVPSPTDLTYVNGTAATVLVSHVNNNLETINTATHDVANAILAWNSYGNGNGFGMNSAADVLRFTLPANGAVLNVVVGPYPTTLAGTIDETGTGGRVYLLNPYGVTLAGTSVIDTQGAFYISTAIDGGSLSATEGYFKANGTLSVFEVPAATTNSAMYPITGTLGSVTGDVYLAGEGLTVGAGTVSGGLFMNSLGAASSIGTTGNLTVGGALQVYSEGGMITVDSGGTSTSVTGKIRLNTATGGVLPAAIVEGGTGLLSAAGASIFGGTVTLGNTDFGHKGVVLTVDSNVGSSLSDVDPQGLVIVSLSISGGGGLTAQDNTGGADVFLGPGATLSGSGGLTLKSTGAGDSIATGSISSPGGGPLTFLASGNISLGAISLGAGGAVNVTSASGTVSAVSITDLNQPVGVAAGGNVALGAVSIGTAPLSVTSTDGNISIPSISAGTIGLAANGGGKTISAGGPGALDFTTLSDNGGATTVSAGGTLTLPAVAIPILTLSSGANINFTAAVASGSALSVTATGDSGTAGSITQAAGGVITANGSATFNAGKSITLSNAANSFGTIVLQGAPDDATIQATTNGVLTIGNGTDLTGSLTAANNGAGGIALGAVAADSIAIGTDGSANPTGVGLTLAATGSGTISTVADNLTVKGSVSLATSNASIGIGAAGSTNSGFGQISANSGAASTVINSGSSANLGAITAANLNVWSAGAIGNTSGIVAVTGTATVSSATSVTLGGPGNNAAIGTVTVANGAGGALSLTDAMPATINLPASAMTSVTAVETGAGGLTMCGGSGSVRSISAATGAGDLTFAGGSGAVASLTATSMTGNIGITTSSGAVQEITATILGSTGNITISAAGSGAIGSVTGTTGGGTATVNDGLGAVGPVALNTGGGAITIDDGAGGLGSLTETTGGGSFVLNGGSGAIGSVAASTGAGSAAINAGGDAGAIGAIAITTSNTVAGSGVLITGGAGSIASISATGTGIGGGDMVVTAGGSVGPISLITKSGSVSVNTGAGSVGAIAASTGGGIIELAVGGSGSVSSLTANSADGPVAVTFAGSGGLGMISGNVGDGSVTVTNDPTSVVVSNMTTSGGSGGEVNISTSGNTSNVTLGSGVALGDTSPSGGLFITSGGWIADTANSPVFVYGAGWFSAGGQIDIGNNTKAGNNFGAVTLITQSNTASVTYIEGGSVNLAQVSEPANYSGTVTVESLTGGIVENAALAGADFGGVPRPNSIQVLGTAILMAANGVVDLEGAFAGAGSASITASAITVGGSGAVSFGDGLTLKATGGNILVTDTGFTVQGGLTVISTGNTDLSALSGAANLFGVPVVHTGVAGVYNPPGN